MPKKQPCQIRLLRTSVNPTTACCVSGTGVGAQEAEHDMYDNEIAVCESESAGPCVHDLRLLLPEDFVRSQMYRRRCRWTTLIVVAVLLVLACAWQLALSLRSSFHQFQMMDGSLITWSPDNSVRVKLTGASAFSKWTVIDHSHDNVVCTYIHSMNNLALCLTKDTYHLHLEKCAADRTRQQCWIIDSPFIRRADQPNMCVSTSSLPALGEEQFSFWRPWTIVTKSTQLKVADCRPGSVTQMFQDILLVW